MTKRDVPVVYVNPAEAVPSWSPERHSKVRCFVGPVIWSFLRVGTAMGDRT
jgi:hypothetical protein